MLSPDDSDQNPFSDFSLEDLPFKPSSVIKWALILIGIISFMALSHVMKGIYTDLLWFDNLDYQNVYMKILTTKVFLFLGGAVLFTIIILPSVIYVYRKTVGDPIETIPIEIQPMVNKIIRIVIALAILILAITFGSLLASQWETLLRFFNEVDFTKINPTTGQLIPATEPVFNKNIGFYVFNIPMFILIQEWIQGVMIVVLIATVSVYFINLSLRGEDLSIGLTPQIMSVVSILLGLLLIVISLGYWIDTYELLFSDRGSIFGAGYTDLNARLPAMRLIILLGFIISIALFANTKIQSIRLILFGAGIWIAAAFVVGEGYPTVVQRFQVDPNELSKEMEYIPRSIDFTRQGFALDRINEKEYPFSPSVDRGMIQANLETIDNIRLWDHRPLQDVYNQKQFFRAYYRFVDVDVDRYLVDGQYRQVMLGARELFSEDLPESSQSWINTHLQFTHGYGIAMSPVTEFTREGQPEYFIKNIPPQLGEGIPPTTELEITQSAVYYGEHTDKYVIVNSNEMEFDYPAVDTDLPVRTNYAGSGGVQLGSLFRRLAYAWEFADINILISGAISSDSRIQYERDIKERIEKIAPFLDIDNDPYLVISEGKLYWMLDAYTTSKYYPYSEPYNKQFNYIRNSAKITVNAYDGSARFYISDPTDAMIQTYDKVFPGLFNDMAEMPETLRKHIRYPQDFFAIQADKYLLYHMTDTTEFYNKEDPWSIPNELFHEEQQPMEPYYVIMKLPGEDKEEFVLLMPFTPLDKPNLVAWMAARSDNDRGQYGSLVSFMFPKGIPIDGPQQVEARIDNDFTIKQQFTLLCQRGARCIRGNLLVIPIVEETGGSIKASVLYAEPLYIQAETIDFPELKQVILADANNVVMSDNLDAAIEELLGKQTDTYATKSNAGTSTVKITGIRTIDDNIDSIKKVLEDLQIDITYLEEGLQNLLESIGDKK
jgi:hypothetical protein